MPLKTTEEMAADLRIKPLTLKDWVRRGLVPAMRITPKTLRFDPEAVRAALLDRSRKGGEVAQ